MRAAIARAASTEAIFGRSDELTAWYFEFIVINLPYAV
jgi:hypothetical protein